MKTRLLYLKQAESDSLNVHSCVVGFFSRILYFCGWFTLAVFHRVLWSLSDCHIANSSHSWGTLTCFLPAYSQVMYLGILYCTHVNVFLEPATVIESLDCRHRGSSGCIPKASRSGFLPINKGMDVQLLYTITLQYHLGFVCFVLFWF